VQDCKGLVIVLWVPLLQYIMFMALPRWYGSYFTIAHSTDIWDDARNEIFLLAVTLLDITNFA
jgi:hypothetical protein